MKIGIDIDGVLTDLADYLLNEGLHYFKEKGISIKNPNAYNVHEIFGVSKELGTNFWKDKAKDYFGIRMRDNASELINKLQEEGNEIYIITSRGEGGDAKALGKDMVMNLTKEWIYKNGINPKEIIFSEGSKLPYCLEKEIDIMIDDSPYNLLDISSKIKCIAYNTIYNENISKENIIRCYSWYDIYYKINEIKRDSN